MKFKAPSNAVAKFDKSGYTVLGWFVMSFSVQVAANEKEVGSLVIKACSGSRGNPAQEVDVL